MDSDSSDEGPKRRRIKSDSELERHLSPEPGSSEGEMGLTIAKETRVHSPTFTFPDTSLVDVQQYTSAAFGTHLLTYSFPEKGELFLPRGIKVFYTKPLRKAAKGITIFEGEKHKGSGYRLIAVKCLPHSEEAINKIISLKPFGQHPHVVRIYDNGIYTKELGNNIYIAMERCSQETLHDYVNRLEEFDCTRALCHSFQIISGLQYIHDKGIAHRGLNPHNVLFVSANQYEQLKITNFAVNEYESGHTSGATGYNAPEVIKCQALIDETKCDIFSLGVLLVYVLSNGKHPYGDESWHRDYNIASGVEPNLSIILLPRGTQRDAIIPLIGKMLQHNPEARPSAQEIYTIWKEVAGDVGLFKEYPQDSNILVRYLPPSPRHNMIAPASSSDSGIGSEHVTTVELIDMDILDRDTKNSGDSGPRERGFTIKDILGLPSTEGSFKQAEIPETSTSAELCDVEEKIKQKLLSPTTRAEEIGPEGGSIDLCGCILSLPAGAHQTKRLAQISIRSSCTDAFEGYVVASPELNCEAFGIPFKGLATITLPLHAIPKDGQVQIISKKDENFEWEILDVHPTLVDRKVTFQVSHFSPFKVIVKNNHSS